MQIIASTYEENWKAGNWWGKWDLPFSTYCSVSSKNIFYFFLISIYGNDRLPPEAMSPASNVIFETFSKTVCLTLEHLPFNFSFDSTKWKEGWISSHSRLRYVSSEYYKGVSWAEVPWWDWYRLQCHILGFNDLAAEDIVCGFFLFFFFFLLQEYHWCLL